MRGPHAWFPAAEETIEVDAMMAHRQPDTAHLDTTVDLTLESPVGCGFVDPGSEAPTDKFAWQFPTPLSLGTDTLDRGNSKSYRLGIRGRASHDVKVEVVVTVTPPACALQSCVWTVSGLGPDTTNLSGPVD